MEVNREVLNELLPPGAQQFNTGNIEFDNPNREQPYAHQFTIGYERELNPVLSASIDYVRQLDRDTHMRQNLNPQVRAGTAPTDATGRVDAFGVLGNTGLNAGDAYRGNVLLTTSNGRGTYNGLNFQMEKRYSKQLGAAGRLRVGDGDRESANFLLLTGLRAGSGFPRQAQFGMRWGF